MSEGWVQGGQLPPQILADQMAPPGSGGAPHYYLPPQIFDPCCMPDYVTRKFLKNSITICFFCKNVNQSVPGVPNGKADGVFQAQRVN